MDEDSVLLLESLHTIRFAELKESLPTTTSQRGGTLVPLLARLIDETEVEHSQILADYKSAQDAAKAALGRKLLRVSQKIDTIHLLSADFSSDVGRQDIPVGLWCLVDSLVHDLLPAGADPIVHLDSNRMYSTLSLNSVAGDFLRDPALSASIGPTIFNLPALDPANVLLAPILAHEVGHSLVSHSNLLNSLYQKGDMGALNTLLKDCLAEEPGADPTLWKNLLNSWLRELVCDALAVVLTGPSFLFASCVFLPAPARGSIGTHPYPADRISFTLGQLTQLGWADRLESESPNVRNWLTELVKATGAPAPGAERFLREAIGLLETAVYEVARDSVSAALMPTDFAEVANELKELFAVGIPASRVSGRAPGPWEVVLGGWESSLRALDDSPQSLTKTAGDAALNHFLVKCLEIARITQVWNEL